MKIITIMTNIKIMIMAIITNTWQKTLKIGFGYSLVFTLPLLFLSSMIQEWFSYSIDFSGRNYLIFAIASFLFFYGGWPFLKGLVDELKQKQPGMMTLIALAITVAYVYSSAIIFGLSGKPFFWELATLIVVMLAGHWIEMKSVMQASGALDKLMELMPDTANKITDDGTKEIKVEKLQTDDKVLVKPGEKIPLDGIIYEGGSSVDEFVITGESKPVEKKKDDEVVGGAINGNSSIKIKVKSSQDDSYLSKVIGMVEEAKKKKSKTQHLADRAAFWLTIIAITVGTVTLAVWLFVGKVFNFALTRMVTVMVIACPHALGLAIPLVVAISTSVSAKSGLLIRNRTSFENSRKIDTVVFDKTGTLTLGEFGVSRYDSFGKEQNKNEILKLAAGLEKESEHPIAIGSGTDVAAETADIILVESDPLDVTKLIAFGKATHKKMIQNLIYATAYNVVALPLGAGVLFWAGIMINPAVGAVLMSLSTVAVAINAQFLKTKLK